MSSAEIDETKCKPNVETLMKDYKKSTIVTTLLVTASLTSVGVVGLTAMHFKGQREKSDPKTLNNTIAMKPRPLMNPEDTRKHQSVLHWIVKAHLAQRLDLRWDNVHTWSDNIYVFQTDKLLQSEATAFCRQKRMSLAKVMSRQENEWLTRVAGKMTAIHLGRVVRPSWPEWWAQLVRKPYTLWRIGRPFRCRTCFDNWSDNQPSQHGCVAVSIKGGQWQQVECHFLTLPFVCKAKLSTVLK